MDTPSLSPRSTYRELCVPGGPSRWCGNLIRPRLREPKVAVPVAGRAVILAVFGAAWADPGVSLRWAVMAEMTPGVLGARVDAGGVGEGGAAQAERKRDRGSACGQGLHGLPSVKAIALCKGYAVRSAFDGRSAVT